MKMSKRRIGQAYLLEIRLECRRVLRTPGFAIPILVLPVGFYWLLGVAIAGGRESAAGPGEAFWFISFAVYGVLGPGLLGISSLLASDRTCGLLEFKRAVPMPYASYIISKVFMAVILSITVAVMISIVAATLGDISLSFTEFLKVDAIVVLGTAPVAAMGLLIATHASPSGSSAISTTLLVLMAILAGLFYPLPGILDDLRAVWPTYHLQQLALASVGRPSDGANATHLLVLVGVTAASSILAAHRLARAS